MSFVALAAPLASDPAVVGLTAERFDQIYALIAGIGTVLALGIGIILLVLAWIAVAGERG